MDRSKDVIKSGGEWISSIEVENAASGHPKVAVAAVIGMPHNKWGERPLLVVQSRDSAAPPSSDEMRHYLKACPVPLASLLSERKDALADGGNALPLHEVFWHAVMNTASLRYRARSRRGGFPTRY